MKTLKNKIITSALAVCVLIAFSSCDATRNANNKQKGAVIGANVTIDSTIINSTYDNYYIIFDQLGATDGQYLSCRLAVGGVIQSDSSYYGYETQRVGGSYGGANYNTSSYFAFFSSASLGNAAGEGVQGWAILQNVNSTVRACSITG